MNLIEYLERQNGQLRDERDEARSAAVSYQKLWLRAREDCRRFARLLNVFPLWIIEIIEWWKGWQDED